MSIIVTVAILIGVVLVFSLLKSHLVNKQKQKNMKDLLYRFSKAGSDHNLSFSSLEVLNRSIIGLDGINRKLLVLKKADDGLFNFSLINLNDVRSCSVKKYYGTIKSGDLKWKSLDQYLQKMVLRFELNNQSEPVDILFYRHPDNNVPEIRELERKARLWEIILSKMRWPLKKINYGRLKNRMRPL